MSASSVLVVVAAVLAGQQSRQSTGEFFPPDADFDVSQRALQRAIQPEHGKAGAKEAEETKRLFSWALAGLDEKPLWSRRSARACRLLTLMHRAFFVATVDEEAKGARLSAKRYDQGTSSEGVAVSAQKSTRLTPSEAGFVMAGFRKSGLWERNGFRRNAFYPDGRVDPLGGLWLLECVEDSRYGFSLFETPVEKSGAEGRAAQVLFWKLLGLVGNDFLTESQRAEFQPAPAAPGEH
jgi:hypothetical protein